MISTLKDLDLPLFATCYRQTRLILFNIKSVFGQAHYKLNYKFSFFPKMVKDWNSLPACDQ